MEGGKRRRMGTAGRRERKMVNEEKGGRAHTQGDRERREIEEIDGEAVKGLVFIPSRIRMDISYRLVLAAMVKELAPFIREFIEQFHVPER